MDYDLVVIGSGSAGTSAAEAAKEFGLKKVAIIEGRERLGGECPNRACVPSKAYLRAAEVLELSRRGAEFGLKIQADFDFSAIMEKKEEAVDMLTKPPRLENYFKNLGVEVIKGWAKFIDDHTLEVRSKKYTAASFIIATGSETFIPRVEGLDQTPYLTSDDFMELREQPPSIIIIGGGPVGMETAHFLATLGTKVTIVQSASQILNREDEEIAAIVADSFRKRGIEIILNAQVKRADKTQGGITLTLPSPLEGEGKGEGAGSLVAGYPSPVTRSLNAHTLLLATGKRPSIGQLNLDKLGMQMDKRGSPVTNEFLQTSIPHIFMAGDVSGHMLFTHTAHYEGELAARNATSSDRSQTTVAVSSPHPNPLPQGERESDSKDVAPNLPSPLRREGRVRVPVDLRVVPRGTFCRPEVGSVGLTEKEARAKGYEVGIGRIPYQALGKSLVMREPNGLIKIIVDKKTDLVLGGHAVGESAAEIVHEIALAMQGNLSYTVMADMIHAFPTFAEGVGAAAFDVK